MRRFQKTQTNNKQTWSSKKKKACAVRFRVPSETWLPGVQLCIVVCGVASSLTALFAARKERKKKRSLLEETTKANTHTHKNKETLVFVKPTIEWAKSFLFSNTQQNKIQSKVY